MENVIKVCPIIYVFKLYLRTNLRRLSYTGFVNYTNTTKIHGFPSRRSGPTTVVEVFKITAKSITYSRGHRDKFHKNSTKIVHPLIICAKFLIAN